MYTGIKNIANEYINTGNGYLPIQMLGTLEVNGEMTDYVHYDIMSLPSSYTIPVKMSKRHWYNIQKALGLIKPVYKKRRKGKRYVWYEVV